MATTRVALVSTLIALAVAGPASARLGENLILQDSFDEGIIGWENLAGKLWEQVDDCRPLPEQPNPGSLEMLADDYVWTCIGIIGDQHYSIGTHVKVTMNGQAYGLFGISVQWHSNSNCTAYMEGPILHPFSHYTGETDWKQLLVGGTAPLNAHSAQVTLGAVKQSGEATEIRVRFDDVLFAPVYTDTTTTTTMHPSSTTTTTDEITTTTDVPNAPGCADPVLPYDTTTVADALFVLRRSVGAVLCDNCYCDTDNSGAATTSDALRTLRIAVGQKVLKDCGGGCQYQ
jgi:hypothetical protein